MRTLLLMLLALTCSIACQVPDQESHAPPSPHAPTEPVGRQPGGRTVTPVNQVLTPYGKTIELAGLRPQALALAPDGNWLYVSGKTPELLVLNAASGDVAQRVPLPAETQQRPSSQPVSNHILEPDREGQLSYTGLAVAADGRTIYLSNVNGSIKVFRVDAAGRVSASHSIPLPPAGAPRRSAEIPAGLALAADGGRLYVCGNLSNRLLEIELENGKVLRSFDVGVAPFDVVLCRNQAFVSNWGGRRPGPGDLSGPAGQGTLVRVDPVRYVASEGSVTLIALESGLTTEVRVGLHASALALAPDERSLVVANSGSDCLSVLDTTDGRLLETIWCKSQPSGLLAATPNALAFDPSGERLYVANGTQNAIAVIDFEPPSLGADSAGGSHLLGLIPVGWFPGAVAYDRRRSQLLVANIKGIGEGRARAAGLANEHNTRLYHGSVSLLPLPDSAHLETLSAQVESNLRQPAIERALLPARKNRRPIAIPERCGEPSLIQHVVYIIKENRTYDQVLGDMPEGNGDASLCIYGAQVTPNQHALARQFVMLDNTYCSGILSADGHNWSTAAFGSDYLERSFAGWPRSYPDGMLENDKDALAYSPAGFLWDHAIAAGVSLRNYGEFCQPRVHWRDLARRGQPDFMACFRTWRGDQDDVHFGSEPVVPSLTPYSPANYVGWNMSVPDQYRADVFLAELSDFELKGSYPQLTLVCLPNDHTSGTSEGAPTPAACLADGDLALGRIVEGLSHSKFWPQMAIFVIEDDPQAGWDHVSGYRTTAFVASPYARRSVTVHSQYNTTSVLRTLEQILGIPPMNQFDASASPMFECFSNKPDLSPFIARANLVPLDQLNPPAAALSDSRLREDALVSASLNLSEADQAPEDLLNHILWRAARGTDIPYPEWAVTPGADAEEED